MQLSSLLFNPLQFLFFQLYRLEKYQEAYDLYLELLKESADDSDNEREANLAAVAAGLAQENPKAVENLPQLEERENFYEIYYNKACIELSRENYPGARQILNDAEGEFPHFDISLTCFNFEFLAIFSNS